MQHGTYTLEDENYSAQGNDQLGGDGGS